MREIKFRAWDKDSKMWSNTPMKYAIEDINYYTDYEWCQYTGLKDSNNKEIYEGDIIKIEDYFGDNIIGKVIYEKVYASYSLMEGDEKRHFKMSLDNLESYVHEIIGNIYENKELLV